MEVIDFFLLWLEVFLTIVQTEETRASYVCRYVNPEYSIKIWRFFFPGFFKNFIQITMVLLFIFVFSLFRFNVIINISRSKSIILLHVFCLFHLFFVPFVLIFALFGLSILFYFLFCLINYKYFVVGIISVVDLKVKVLVAQSYLTLCNPMD